MCTCTHVAIYHECHSRGDAELRERVNCDENVAFRSKEPSLKQKLKSVRFHRHEFHHQHISLFRGYVLDLIHFLSTTTLPVVFFLFFFLQYLLTKYLPSESAALAKIMTLI